MTGERADMQVIHADGTVSVREIFTIVFYIRRPNLEIVDSIDQAILAFVELVSLQALPGYYNYEGEQEDLTAQSLRALIHERLHGPYRAPNATIELIGSGIYAPDYYLRYYGSALTVPGLEDEVSYLSCWMPRSFYASHSEQVFAYIMALAANLPFSFAYASLGLAGEDALKKQALARRYPGLDIADPGCIRADLGSKAAGSYWLTLLGQELSSSLGGIAALRSQLSAAIEVKDLAGGKCLIQLGEEPRTGDVNRRDLLPLQRELAKFIHDNGKLHIPARVVYFVDQDGLAARDAMEKWHMRFLD